MKKTILKRCNPENERIPHYTTQRCLRGQVLEVRMPDFDGPIYHVPRTGKSSEEAARAKLLYKKEVSKGSVNDLGPVHGHHIPGDPASSTVSIMIVPEKEHRSHLHYGPSALDNNEWCQKKINAAGNGNTNSSQRIATKIEYSARKHPEVTGIIAGTATTAATSLIYNRICKFLNTKTSPIGYGICAAVGLTVGVLTSIKLNDGVLRM